MYVSKLFVKTWKRKCNKNKPKHQNITIFMDKTARCTVTCVNNVTPD